MWNIRQGKARQGEARQGKTRQLGTTIKIDRELGKYSSQTQSNQERKLRETGGAASVLCGVCRAQ